MPNMPIVPRQQSNSRRRQRYGTSLVATTLIAVGMPLAATPASAAIVNPPANGHSIISFPARDFVSAAGYARGDRPIVEVLRGGFVVGTTLPVTPQDDLGTPGIFEGLVDINHGAPEPCWEGVTPNIQPGDVIRVSDGLGNGDETVTAGVTVTQPATRDPLNSDVVTVKGTAVSATGGQIPVDQLESRVVANKQEFVKSGTRTLRADFTGNVAGGADGFLAYDGPLALTWTATWTGMNAVSTVDGLSDGERAVANESRAMWNGANPLVLTEQTIYEFGQVKGPGAGCLAPAAVGPSTPDMTAASDSGVSSVDNVTSNTTPTFAGLAGVAGATSANLYVDGVLNGSAPVTGTSYSLTPNSPLSDGPHQITVGATAAAAEMPSNGALAITVDTLAPAAPNVTSAVAVAGSTTAVSVKGNAEGGAAVSLSTNSLCTPVVGSSSAAAFASPGIAATVAAGSITKFFAKATDPAGNASACSTSSVTYAQDSVRPTVLTRTPATNATGVAQAGNLTARFSENVVGVGGSTFTLKKSLNNAAVTGAVTYNATTRTATLNPTASLAAGTRYTATVTSGVKDAAGNTLLTSAWSFTTGPRQVVTAKSPAANAINVKRLANVTAKFSEHVIGSTTAFTLKKTSTGALVGATVTYNATTHVATLNPRVTLSAKTRYTAVLSARIWDLDSNTLAPTSWTFTTGAS
jgi:methionine-rich copper-binding protein CopC